MKVTSALLALALAAFGSVKAQEGPSDVTILNYALTLEYLEANFYAGALRKFNKKAFQKAGYPAFVYERVRALAAQEASHASFLAGALGDAATVPCTYNFPYRTIPEFLALSRVLEGVGVSAYLGAAADITEDAYLTAAGSILTVEARHQAVISEIQGASGFPSAYDTPLSYSQVFSLAAPFIVSCPPNAAPLPVVNFPDLSVGRVGRNGFVTLTYEYAGEETQFAHFLNGLQDVVVPINGRTTQFPTGLTGTVYVVVSNSEGPLTDANTIAGPAIVILPSPGDKMVPVKKPAHKPAPKPHHSKPKHKDDKKKHH